MFNKVFLYIYPSDICIWGDLDESLKYRVYTIVYT